MAFYIMELLDLIGWQLLLTSVVCSMSVIWYIRTFWMPVSADLPPGPPRIPFPFHILVAMSSTQGGVQPLLDINKKYGDVAFIHLGNRKLLLVSDSDLVKDLLVKQADHTSGRTAIPALDQVLNYNNGGIIFSSGDVWLENRRFALKALRTMGMGKRSLEQQINAEAEMVCTEFSRNQLTALNPASTIHNAVSNIICSITFGHRFEYSDLKFKEIIYNLDRAFNENVGFLVDLPLIFFRKLRSRLLVVKGLIDEEISLHKKNFDGNDLRDLIDMYLDETKRLQEAGESTHLNPDCFWTSIADMFVAGTETTKTLMLWSILVLADNPEILKRITGEVDTIIGQGRKPVYEDRHNMMYTQAFLLEVMRFRPIVPVGVPHLVNSDRSIRGYHIPKGTEVVMNIMAMNHDSRMWADPEIFKPERFLSKDGKSIEKPPQYMPFGAGRRICLGEQLAKMESFLFLANLVQRFSFQLPSGVKANYDYGDQVQVMAPKPYDVLFKER